MLDSAARNAGGDHHELPDSKWAVVDWVARLLQLRHCIMPKVEGCIFLNWCAISRPRAVEGLCGFIAFRWCGLLFFLLIRGLHLGIARIWSLCVHVAQTVCIGPTWGLLAVNQA
jgi:hypothetical protein